MSERTAPGAPPTLSFRHPGEEDHRRLVADVDRWYGRRVKPLLGRAWFVHFASTSWIAELPDGRMAAFVIGFVSPDRVGEAVVHLTATNPELRRRGVGTAIHERWLADVASRGATRAVVAVPPDDRTAVLFYRSLGFEAELDGARPLWGVPAFADYDAEGVDRALFVRTLAPGG